MFKTVITLPVLLLGLACPFATALVPFDTFREGSCSGVNLTRVPSNGAFIDSLKYISAGNRYNIYSVAAAMPNYETMRDDDLYYDACYTRNTTITVINSTGTVFGFGRPLASYRIVTTDIPETPLQGIPTDPSKAWNPLVDALTLTDNRTFAFIVQCHSGVDQRAWVVISITPNIEPRTQRAIEDHAASLGFRREEFVFLRQDSCRLGLGNPDLEEVERPSWRRRNSNGKGRRGKGFGVVGSSFSSLRGF